ncbi:uncharacterized protein EAF01_006546 [Botrytis porri]|uniref:BTB domain-containing protein n=1 Tax=Botrytis porri TaxID=87229 RepID=A0A4Z1KPV7_9HELO|nr:uncharacterized protein EAF01_006546 [Botrytis porri]KAF7903497.1 hypothetical protein EAF01_006546 [Botrytis porri]TGO83449.1 hypothetical protein BPOR_0645g00010 [Botrytis porri]
MAQESKKRKYNEDLTPEQQETPSPIVFLALGVKADTRFTVFNQEFHLHSSGLKHHSNYFRKFLDSDDKQPAPACALFKYDHRSVIDEDGGWALMPASDSPEITEQQMTLVDGPDEEIESVRKLLCAIHSKNYKIETTDELERLTLSADYYCALPVVSATLTGALFKSSLFDVSPTIYNTEACVCQDDCVTLLLLARKLRHGVLFRECLIYTVGRWDSLSDLEKGVIKEDQELYRLVQTKLSILYKLLAKTQSALIWALCSETVELNKIIECNYSKGSIGGCVAMYRCLCNEHSFDRLSGEEETKELGDLILSLLKNNLALGCTGEDSGKEDGAFEETYLCTEIEDDELPWDLEKMDW